MKRRLLAVVVSLFLLFVGQAVSVTPANAWSGSLESCSGFPSGLLASIRSDSRYNENTSWVAFERDWYGAPFYGYPAVAIVWGQPGIPTSSSQQLYFEGNGIDDSQNSLAIPVGASLYKDIDGTLTPTSAGYGYSYMNMYDLNCVQDTHNVLYYQYYGAHYPDKAASQQIYNGTIDCGVSSLAYLEITQDGESNAVPLTYESTYRASWSYWLSDNPYGITVGCGNKVAASFGTVTPMPPTSNDWMCDPTSNPAYCVLS